MRYNVGKYHKYLRQLLNVGHRKLERIIESIDGILKARVKNLVFARDIRPPLVLFFLLIYLRCSS